MIISVLQCSHFFIQDLRPGIGGLLNVFIWFFVFCFLFGFFFLFLVFCFFVFPSNMIMDECRKAGTEKFTCLSYMTNNGLKKHIFIMKSGNWKVHQPFHYHKQFMGKVKRKAHKMALDAHLKIWLIFFNHICPWLGGRNPFWWHGSSSFF